MSNRVAFGISLAFALATLGASSPAPTPTPGGANQVGAVSGALGATLFNGIIRFKLEEVRSANAADHPESVVPLPDQRVFVVTALIKNAQTANFQELVSYTLADKDDVTFEIPGHYFTPVSLNIQQGASARQTAVFPIDKNFVPVKLIFACESCGSRFKPFRVTLPSPSP